MMQYQVMPELIMAEYQELKDDIAERGVMVPIEFDEHGNVLDGHHRLRICAELGIEDYPKVIRAGMSESEKRTHARKLNMARRHLTQEQRREMIREQLAETPERSDRQIAVGLGVSHVTVGAQRKGLEATGQIDQLNTSIGADGKERPRQVERKPVAIFNPTPREEKAIHNQAVLNKLSDGARSVADAQREVRRDELIAKLESVSAREAKAVQGIYDVIVIDPPWPMQKVERDERPNQVGLDYPTMTEGELAELTVPAADNCHIWLWTTHKFLPMAMRLLGVWGLKYVCTFVWHKSGGPQPFGLPQYNCEFAVYARKGTPEFIDTKAFFTCLTAQRGAHSEKPDAFYDMVRRVTAGRRLDMFNRRAIDGFDVWGKEAGA